MCNTLELSPLFVCLGDLLIFSVPVVTEKITGLWFAGGGICTQADNMNSRIIDSMLNANERHTRTICSKIKENDFTVTLKTSSELHC